MQVTWSVSTNQRPVCRSRGLFGPIRGQYYLPPEAPGRPDVQGAEAGRGGDVDQGVPGVQTVNQREESIFRIDQ